MKGIVKRENKGKSNKVNGGYLLKFKVCQLKRFSHFSSNTFYRPYVENGEAFEDEHHGYASGSSSYRDRTNHHSKRRENVAGEDSLRERIQGKHGMYDRGIGDDWQFC